MIAKTAFRFFVLTIGMFALVSCGGGGGSSNSSSSAATAFSINTNSLTFSASNPYSPTPVAQSVTATVNGVSSGTLYVLVTASGSAVANVSNISISGNTGTGSITVKVPALLGSGNFTGTVSIRACLNDSTCATGELSGSPRTVNVTYNIGAPTLASTVMPYVVTAGKVGQVVLRGTGFNGTTSVNFGSTPATAFTIVNDNTIRATYPATLAPGALTVNLTGSTTPFNKTILAVGPQTYPAATLTYPEVPSRILATVFDAERQSILVAAMFDARSNNKLWRYRFVNGAWTTAEVVAIPELRDIVLSADGSRIYALTTTAIQEYDATTPGGGALRTVSIPFASTITGQPYPVRFALGNDGTMFVTTGAFNVQSSSPSYLYVVASGIFTNLGTDTTTLTGPNGLGSGLVASADGSVVIATRDPSFTTQQVPLLLKYIPAGGLVPQANLGSLLAYHQFPHDQPVALDSSGNKIVFTDTQIAALLSGSQFVGYLADRPGSNGVTVINPQGTRAYAIGQDNVLGGPTILGYDLTLPPLGSPLTFSGSGPAVAQAIPSANSQLLRTAITPDGTTLFVVGDAGVAVIPAPN